MRMIPAPSLLRVQELYDFDASSGVFRWRKKSHPRSNIRVGAVAGTVSHGRRKVSVDRRTYFASRLVWFICSGEWPVHEVDHINGDCSDDRFENLRDVPRGVNQQNIRRRKGGRPNDLPQGVTFTKAHKTKPFSAQIGRDRKTIHIGYFADPQEAHQAYLRVKRLTHEGCTL